MNELEREPEEQEQKSVILVEATSMQMTRRQRLELARTGLAPGDVLVFHPELTRPRSVRSAARPTNSSSSGGSGGGLGGSASGAKTSLVIKAFNYKLRLDLELNDVLFGPNLVQKHFIPKGTHISAHQLDNCYYHARSSSMPNEPSGDERAADSGREFTTSNAIGAFRTCNGLSADLSKKQPHIIYRYQSSGSNRFSEDRTNQGGQPSDAGQAWECGNLLAPNEWRQFSSKRSQADAGDHPDTPQPAPASNSTADVLQEEQERFGRGATMAAGGQHHHLLGKRDVGLTSKYIELALLLSHDMFLKRNTSSRLEVLHDAIQVVNCLDLYFRHSTNTRVGLVYIETWAHGDQIELSEDPRQTLLNLLDYSTRHLYASSKDAVHLITGGHSQQFRGNAFGMAVPDSVCTPNAVSVSQESSILEPFLTAATMAHLLGHNLGMEHDEQPPAMTDSGSTGPLLVLDAGPVAAPSSGALTRQKQVTPSGPSPGPSTRWPPPAMHKGAHHRSSSESMGDEEEVKSRSLVDQSASTRAHQSSAVVAPVADGPDDQLVVDELADCRPNCIMNERFVFAPAPVALGNMRIHNAPGDSQQQQQQHSTAVSIQQAAAGGQQTPAEVFAVRETSISAPSNASFLPESVEFFDSGGGQQATGPGQQVSSSLPFGFSRQSVETYFSLLRDGRFYCLWNKPNKLEGSIAPTCGNGIVEQGEACDCGSRADCWSDTCCERLTCKFRKGRECISGACCDRCRFRPRGTLCRRARNECDLPEYCDGKSPTCASDVFKQNGWPCNSNTGYCFMGQCPGHESQCAELWGSGARSADKLCYSQFNSNGTLLGNCGLVDGSPAAGRAQGPSQTRHLGGALTPPRLTAGGAYKRCEPEHLMCGTLQCKLGDMKPVTADLDEAGGTAAASSASHDFSRKVLRVAGRELECKVIIRTGSANHKLVGALSYVRDGSKCADGKVCFNQTCLTLERAYPEPFEMCPRDEQGQLCSQHGVCSSANKCQCEPNWTGDDCSRPAPPPPPAPPLASVERAQTPTLIELTAAEQPDRPSNLSLPAGSSHVATAPTSPTPTSSTTSTTTTSASVAASTQTSAASGLAQHQHQHQHQTTTSNQIDRSKRSALEATTLVYILVASVAAVYLGFALMANCYRRKGLIRPDKVLRHHQMNCKMDALRSSFIAKRLADPEGLTLEASPSLSNFNEMLTNGSIPNINATKPWTPLLSQAPMGPPASSAQLVQEFHDSFQARHHQKLNLIDGDEDEDELELELELQRKPAQVLAQPPQQIHMTAASSIDTAAAQQKPPAAPPPPLPPSGTSGSKRQTIQATVHYLDRANQLGGSGDHIPLLVSGHAGEQVASGAGCRPVNQAAMSSFGLGASNQRAGSRHHLQRNNSSKQQFEWHEHESTTMPARHRIQDAEEEPLHLSQSLAPRRAFASVMPPGGFINRTTSLGSVHRCAQQLVADEMYETETQDEDEGGYEEDLGGVGAGAAARHRDERCGFATPLRAVRLSSHAVRHRTGSLAHQVRTRGSRDAPGRRAGLDRLPVPEFDSCSAPSSPDGGHQAFWDDDPPYHFHAMRSTSGAAPFKQQISLERPCTSRRQLNDAEPSNASDSRSLSPDAPPPPPPQLDQFLPPPPPPLDQCWSNLDGRRRAHQQHRNHQHRQPNHKHDQRARAAQDELMPPPPPPHQHQPIRSATTLIEQLQQLERIQSLQQKHATQVGDTGLHEFFSLPLSVQLSALLARTLADGQGLDVGGANQQRPMQQQQQQQQSVAAMQIDEYLTITLNGGTNLGSPNRRSFKGAQMGARARERATPKPGEQAAHQDTQQQQQQQQQQAGSSAANSRGGTLRRHNNLKLQNLQTLISRLQKLHNQTMMQQRLEGCDGDDDSADYEGEDRLGAAGDEAVRAGTHPPTEAADDDDDELNLADAEDEDKSGEVHKPGAPPRRARLDGAEAEAGAAAPADDRAGGARPKLSGRMSSRSSLRNELVYSVSDSDDTAETLEAARRIIVASAPRRQHSGESGAVSGNCTIEPNGALHHQEPAKRVTSQNAGGAPDEQCDKSS